MSEENANNGASPAADDASKVEFTAEQQKKIDEIISQRLKNANEAHAKELKDLNDKHKLDLDEAEKKAKMSAEQLKQHEDEKLKKELETLKQEKQQREHLDAIDKLFKESGLNPKISQKLFSGFADLEVAKAEMSNLKKSFEDAVLEEVNKRLTSHTPKQGASNNQDKKENPFLRKYDRFNFQKVK